MFILTHAAMTGFPAWYLNWRWYVVVLLAVLGALPDIVYPIASLFTGELYGSVYTYWHTFHWWMVFVFPVGIHVAIDSITHNPDPPFGWYEWAWTLDIMLAAAMGWLTVVKISGDKQ